MATLSEVSNSIDLGNQQDLTVPMTGPVSYATGGEDLLVSEIPLRVGLRIDHLEGKAPSGRSVRYDRANDKLLWIEPAGTEVPNATDLSAEIADVRIVGR